MSPWWLETAKKTALWVPVFLTIRENVAGIAVVNGASMEPTLNPSQQWSRDRVLLDKWSIKRSTVHRGDVVVLRSPDTPDTAMVKRVLAVAGDWVRPRHGSVVQVPKGETFVQEESAHSYLFYFRMAGHCWVEGDNSGHSYDSNAFGAVPVALVTGRVTNIIWPLSRISTVESSTANSRKDVLL